MAHFIHSLADWWHQQSWLQIIAFVTGLACVYLAAINNIWNWPVAIISTAITIYVMAITGFYADMLQNIYLTVINIYGWYLWTRKGLQEIKKPIIPINGRHILYTLLAVVFITPILGYLLITFTAKLNYRPPVFPYLDSFCTVVSLSAQLLMARKVLENWLIWIFVDIVYVFIYSIKGLDIYAALFAVYTVLAVLGYFDWRKDYRKQAV